MWGRSIRGNHSENARVQGAGARLAVPAAALALVLGGCALGDPVTKSRTESVRGAAWPGVETEQVSLQDGAPVIRMITPTPEPSSTPLPFFWTFEPPGGSRADAGGSPTVGPVVPPTPGRVFWPVTPPPDEAGFEELDHTPTAEPSAGPGACDAVGVLPAQCDPEPEPCDDGGNPGEECEPPDCDDSGAGGGEPTTPPSSGTGDGEPTTAPPSGTGTSTPTPSPTGGSGDGEPCEPTPSE